MRGPNNFGLLSLAMAAALAVPAAQGLWGIGQNNNAGKSANLKPKKAASPARQARPIRAPRPPAKTATQPAPKPDSNNPASSQPVVSNPGTRSVPRAQNLPPQWMDRLQKLTPAEQERFMQNNERFRNLPPAQKAQIRQRLQEFRQLSPEQRQQRRERAGVWERIPPEQRERVRQEILPRWKQMSPDRREEIKRRLNALNGLTADERAAKLHDPNFVRGLDASEQEMLQNLSNLGVTSSSSPPQKQL